jgi:hypothetical protein
MNLPHPSAVEEAPSSLRVSPPHALLSGPRAPLAMVADESLVPDFRAGLSPAQMVERKLLQVLRGNPMPVSHLLHRSRR